MKVAALRGALTDRAASGAISIVASFVDGDVPSTKDAMSLIAAAVGDARKILVIADRDDELTWKSLRNAPSVHLIATDQLNTYDVLNSDHLVFTRDAYDAFIGGAQ
jgi:large subunit ribosomal protein L4